MVVSLTDKTAAHQPKSRFPDNSLQAGLELGVAYALIMAAIWTVNPWQKFFYWTAIVWVVVTTFLHFKSWEALGLDVRGVPRTLWIPLAAAGAAAIAVYVAHADGALHPLRRPAPLFAHVWGYLVWALMQQFLLQIYFQLRLQRLLPGQILPAVAATGLFALAHLPNPVLTPLTLLWGCVACLLFLRYRNIYALGLAHGLLGLCVAVTVPDSLLHHMRVGIGYLRYHPHGLHHRSHTDQTVSTSA
jgi:hypothetical protein